MKCSSLFLCDVDAQVVLFWCPPCHATQGYIPKFLLNVMIDDQPQALYRIDTVAQTLPNLRSFAFADLFVLSFISRNVTEKPQANVNQEPETV